MFAFLLAAFVAAPAAAESRPAPAKPLPASIDGLPIGAIPEQTLPTGGCAAFLWSKTQTRALVAMLTNDPAQIRFAPGGAVTDLVRVAQSGAGARGFAAKTDYAGGDFRVTIDMDVVNRADIADGAAIPEGTLRLDREGQDTVIVPVAGLIGCG
ncbi:MAG: hypothetical protein B7Y45_09015 [Sphingomonas sp. 28-66-16]|nr:MAG: hypothetical protein B7Y45_09015 [Sphingomonas sp. 28-66-16]